MPKVDPKIIYITKITNEKVILIFLSPTKNGINGTKKNTVHPGCQASKKKPNIKNKSNETIGVAATTLFCQL